MDIAFPKRPGFNTSGKPCVVEVNQFRVKKIDASMKIFQYDVSVDAFLVGLFVHD